MEPRPVAGGTRSVLLVVFTLASALHLYAWYVHPGRPSLTNNSITGWYGGSRDQIEYIAEARALASGHLPGTYWGDSRWQGRTRPPGAAGTVYAYGLGYPILGVPFVWLGLDRDPFLVPDTIAFGVICCMTFLLARRFVDDTAALVFTIALAVASPLLRFTVMTWNTTTTTIAVLASLLVVTSERRDLRIGLGLGAALSLCYAARYTDVAWCCVIVAAGLFLRGGSGRTRGTVALVAATAVTLGLTFIAVGWTQHAVFGDFFRNPYHYHLHNGNRGDSLADFRLAQVPRAFTEVFVTARSGPQAVDEPHTSVLRAFPWVVAAPFGLALLWRRRHRYRGVIAVAAAASVAASVFYLAYWSGTGADLVNNNIRFFVPWFALWGLLAAVAYSGMVRRGAAVLQGSPTPAATAGRSWLWWGCAALIPVALAAIARFSLQAPTRVDLVERFGEVEKRPVTATFDVRPVRMMAVTQPAVSAPVPSRLTWSVTIPDHARLAVALAVDEDAAAAGQTIEFRIGISDGSTYADLLVRRVNPGDNPADRGWLPVTIDLESYSGRRVGLIFGTNTLAPLAPGTRAPAAYWGAPVLSGYVP